jgi:hypothetical protein
MIIKGSECTAAVSIGRLLAMVSQQHQAAEGAVLIFLKSMLTCP